MRVEVLVHEGGLHQSLTIIEDTIYLDSGDILAEGRELTLLNGRHLALGVEDIDMYAFHAEEAIGHSGTRVAGGGNEDVHSRGPPDCPRGGLICIPLGG